MEFLVRNNPTLEELVRPSLAVMEKKKMPSCAMIPAMQDTKELDLYVGEPAHLTPKNVELYA